MGSQYVSCIMPTANRELFVPMAVDYFLNQSYRDAELIIVDDGKRSLKSLIPEHYRVKYFYTAPLGSIGVKRNYACALAKGEIIVHWDDDDWYGYDWIARQVTALETSGADICGLDQISFFSPLMQKYWNYNGSDQERPWLSGATMVYRKSFWENHPFKDIQVGEDYDYIWNNNAKIFAHDYNEGFCAILHADNTTLKPFENRRHKRHAIQYMDVKYEGNTENPEESRKYN
jgi:glycosyltransferase involved in cell wall biosynthesis